MDGLNAAFFLFKFQLKNSYEFVLRGAEPTMSSKPLALQVVPARHFAAALSACIIKWDFFHSPVRRKK